MDEYLKAGPDQSSLNVLDDIIEIFEEQKDILCLICAKLIDAKRPQEASRIVKKYKLEEKDFERVKLSNKFAKIREFSSPDQFAPLSTPIE